MRKATSSFGMAADRNFIRVNRRLKELNLKAAVARKNLKGAFGPLASVAPIGGIAAVTAGLAGAVRQTIALDDAATAAAGKFGLFDRGSASFKKIEDAARRAGATTEFTAAQAAEALRNQATAGFTLEQSVSGLLPLLNLATAAQADLAVTTDVAAKTMNAFGLTSKDASINTKNLTSTTDILMKTINTSGFSALPDILTAVGNGAATVAASGGDLSTFSASIGKLASSGIEASKTGTDVRNIFLAFTKTTGASAKILKKAGVSAFDKTTGKMRDMFDILGDLNKNTSKWKDQQRQAAFATLFGARTVSSANILMGHGTEVLKKYRAELRGSQGETAKVAELQRKTLGNAFKVMASSLAETGITLVNVFKPALVGTLGAIIKASRGIADFVKENETLVKILGAGAAALGAYLVSMVLYRTAALAMVKIQTLLTGAQWLLNAAMLANPIGLVVVSVLALVAIYALLLAKMGILKPVLHGIAEAFKIGWVVMKAIALLLWNSLGPAIDSVSGFFANLGTSIDTSLTPFIQKFIPGFEGFVDVAKRVGRSILDWIVSPLQSVLMLAAKLPGVGTEFADAAAKLERFKNEAFQSDGIVTGAGITGGTDSTPVNLRRAQLERQETVEKQKAEITINDRTGSATMKKSGGGGIPISMTSTNAAFAGG
jgi:TP901 family phage tail tape measure protein